MANPEDSLLRATLGIEWVTVRSDSIMQIQIWYQDLFGSGGCGRGFAYLGEPPASVVDSIETRWGTCPAEDVELYWHIEGNRYLYCRAVN